MGMSPRLLRPRAGGFHPDAADWRTRVVANGGTVSSSTMKAVDTFCRSIASAGIRDRFYRLNLFAGTGLSAALVPLYRGPSLGGTQFGGTTDTNTNFVSGDYVETGATGGLKGNGTNKTLNTGLAGTALSAGDRHVSSYEIISATSDYSPSIGSVGATAANMHAIGPWTNSATVAYRTHNIVGGNATATKNLGLWVGSDTSATASVLYRNGSSVASTSGQSAGGSSTNNYLAFGATGEFSEAALGGYSIGLSMTAGQVSSYYTAMQAFQTAMSRNV